MSEGAETISIRLGPLKKPWDDYCRARGRRPSTAIREAIEAQLGQATAGAKPALARQVERQGADKSRKRYPLHLEASEREAIQKRATAEGMSMQRWIIACVRTALTHEPQFGMRELEALGESNYQLLSIGRNLNQIAKRLNEGKREQVTVERIEALRKVIEAHTTAVATAMQASVARWGLE